MNVDYSDAGRSAGAREEAANYCDMNMRLSFIFRKMVVSLNSYRISQLYTF